MQNELQDEARRKHMCIDLVRNAAQAIHKLHSLLAYDHCISQVDHYTHTQDKPVRRPYHLPENVLSSWDIDK